MILSGRMRVVIVLFAAVLFLAGCQKGDSSTSRGEAKPPELAGTGKPVPPGFVTRFTGPDGKEVDLGYTQMWAALYQGKMAIKLTAQAGTSPDRGLSVYLDVSNRRPARVEDLAGAWLTAFPPSADGFIYQPTLGDRQSMYRAQSAAVSITSISDDAIEGTFTADLGGGQEIADGVFRAARSPNLEPDSLGALARRAQ